MKVIKDIHKCEACFYFERKGTGKQNCRGLKQQRKNVCVHWEDKRDNKKDSRVYFPSNAKREEKK